MTVTVKKNFKGKFPNEKDKCVLTLIFGKPQRTKEVSKTIWALLLAFALTVVIILSRYFFLPNLKLNRFELLYFLFFFLLAYLLTRWMLEIIECQKKCQNKNQNNSQSQCSR